MSTKPEREQRFPMGQITITAHALDVLPAVAVNEALYRHSTGDWGDVGKEDWLENELSLREGFRLLSVYFTASGVKFWIITEADRSSTTVLLPEDY